MDLRDLGRLFPDGLGNPFFEEEALYSNFRFARTLALKERFNGATTEEEFFSYLWNQNEMQPILSKILPMPCKNKKASEIARSNGNRFFGARNYELALLHYNISILSAPHPPIIFDNTASVSANKETENLCTGEPENEPQATGTFTDESGDSVPEDTTESNANDEQQKCCNIANAKEKGVEFLYEEFVKVQKTVTNLHEEVTVLREKVSCMSKEIATLRERVVATEGQVFYPGKQSTMDELSAEAESKEVDTAEYRELALAYANRSAVLLELKQYKECMEDIALAFKYGYPKSSREKLVNRRKKCEAALETGPYVKLVSYHCLCEQVALTNPKILGASDSVELSFTPAKGRSLVAKTNIRPGEILIDHKALIYMGLGQCPKNCNTCMVQCYTPLPCPNCIMAVFCSEACRTEGLTGDHEKECIPTNYFLDSAEYFFLQNLMMKTTFAKLKDLVPKLRTEAATKPPTQLGFNEEGVYDPSDYRAFYHLLTNKDYHEMDSLFNFCMKAVVFLKHLLISEKFFVDEAGNPFTPSSEDQIFVGGILFHHFLNVYGNNGIALEIETTLGSTTFKPGVAGNVFSPTVAMVNHSCYPSATLTTCGNRVIVMATRSIRAGEEVTLTYIGDLVYQEPETTRKQRLLSNFFFLCHCIACEGKWSEFSPDKSRRTFKCLACGGPVNPKLKTCMDCNLDFLKSNGENVYDLEEVGRKIGQATQTFLQNWMHKPVTTMGKEEAKSLTSIIEIFDKYVYPPDEVHLAAQRVLVEWFTLSRRHYVKIKGF